MFKLIVQMLGFQMWSKGMDKMSEDINNPKKKLSKGKGLFYALLYPKMFGIFDWLLKINSEDR